jgi:hypothetical protein
LRPAGFTTSWTESSLWQEAQAIPDVHVAEDKDGIEARLFASHTSGQTILYDGNGCLLFSGGITSGRGHSGDNAGRDSIIALVNGGKGERGQTSVFGCSLFSNSGKGQSNHLCNQ